MTGILRFNKVIRRLEAEATRNARLAKTAERIKRNIERTRNYELTPEEYNVLTSNRRKGATDNTTNFSYITGVLDSYAEAGVLLAERINESVENFQRDSREEDPSFWKNGCWINHVFCGIDPKLVNGLYKRTMTEQEYMDYLEGMEPFARFEWKREEIELFLGPEKYVAARKQLEAMSA